MELITPQSPQKDYSDKKIVFLAGPIKGAPDWQKKAVADLSDLDVYVANPRRENAKDFDLDLQIGWESSFLSLADVIMFWIPQKDMDIAGREYAQTTRFELSEWAAKTRYNRERKKIVVGIDDAFFGKSYIVKRLAAEDVVVYDNYAKTLAEVRKLLKERGRVFFTSDTHFGSERTLLISRRPFASVQEMDEALVSNWNKKVSPFDEVYHLGDFGNFALRPYLNGNIHLVLGNYEENAIKENPEFKKDLEKYFASISPNKILSLKDGEPVFLTHKPSGCHRDMFNLFGHIHGLKKVSRNGLNIGVDVSHFAPVPEDDALFFKNAVIKDYDYEVFL